MVFKRRDKRPFWRVIVDFLYPRGGWGRAYQYVKHRLRRLPDPPHRIARGIFAGVFTSFTPFFGFHFVVAALIARVMQGNIIAALLATFFGNPITFPIIATASLQLGHVILGTQFADGGEESVLAKFSGAGSDLWNNFFALFTEAVADWSHLQEFYSEVFLPYLVGGTLPGVVTATILYYISVPVIAAYKNRRKGRLKAKLEEIRAKKAAKQADDADKEQ